MLFFNKSKKRKVRKCLTSVKFFLRRLTQWMWSNRKLRIWSHLLKKSWMENFIFCAVSLLILSEFKRINFGSPWNHQKTYCTRSKIWKRSHSEMSNIFISISFKAKIENVALFFILFCKTLKTFAMEISIFLKYFSTPPPVP